MAQVCFPFLLQNRNAAAVVSSCGRAIVEEKQNRIERRLRQPRPCGLRRAASDNQPSFKLRMELCIERETTALWQTKWEEGHLPRLELHPAERLEAPADLGDWVCPATTLAWVAQHVEARDRIDFQQAARRQQLPAFQRKLMLCVLAYAYARQMFDAEEIARACEEDPVLRRLCGGRAPLPADLQSFRRSNRAALEEILSCVFESAIRHRFDLGRIPLPAGMERDLRALASERLDIARHMEVVDS